MSNYYIPKPCHEKWDKMSPQEKGRHCDVCDKVVVDFTKKTEQEINHVLENTEGQVCGHFSLSQLHQGEQMKVFRNPVNLFNRNWKYFALSVLGIFAWSKKAEAQKTRGRVHIPGKPALVEHDANISPTRVYGTVFSPNHQPLGGAEVVLLSGGEELGRTKTMSNGLYVFTIEHGKLKGKNIDLQVYHSFYEPKLVSGLQIPKASNRVNITLEFEMFIMGDIIEVRPEDTIRPVGDTVSPALQCQPDTHVVHPSEKTEIKKEEPIKEDEPNEIGDDVNPINNVLVRPEEITSTIFPNPAGTYATIYCSQNTSYQVELFDEKGQLQLTKTFSGDRADLDVSRLSRGTYLVKVQDGQAHIQTLKLVKQ